MFENLSWIPGTILSIATVYFAWDAKRIAKKTGIAVDGKMAEFKIFIESKALADIARAVAEATLKEKESQEMKKGIAAVAALEHGIIIPPIAPPSTMVIQTPIVDVSTEKVIKDPEDKK